MSTYLRTPTDRREPDRRHHERRYHERQIVTASPLLDEAIDHVYNGDDEAFVDSTRAAMLRRWPNGETPTR